MQKVFFCMHLSKNIMYTYEILFMLLEMVGRHKYTYT